MFQRICSPLQPSIHRIPILGKLHVYTVSYVLYRSSLVSKYLATRLFLLYHRYGIRYYNILYFKTHHSLPFSMPPHLETLRTQNPTAHAFQLHENPLSYPSLSKLFQAKNRVSISPGITISTLKSSSIHHEGHLKGRGQLLLIALSRLQQIHTRSQISHITSISKQPTNFLKNKTFCVCKNQCKRCSIRKIANSTKSPKAAHLFNTPSLHKSSGSHAVASNALYTFTRERDPAPCLGKGCSNSSSSWPH